MPNSSWMFNVLIETCRYVAASPLSRRRQIEALRDLADHQLADIGLTRKDVEAARPALPPQLPSKLETRFYSLPSARRLECPLRPTIR